MLELARLSLSPTGSRAARDPHELHILLMRAFADDVGGRAGASLLYRLESEETVLAQYAAPADWSALGRRLAGVATREVATAHAAIRPGQALRFLLHANPTFDGVVDGRRRRTAIRDAERQMAWITRKLAQSGARPLDRDGRPQIAIGETWTQRGRGRGKPIIHHGVAFRGALVVDDADALRIALRAGIGRGRAYGFGLLTVAP